MLGKEELPTVESLDKMKYLNNVWKESLRMCPPAHTLIRQTTSNVELGGYLIPKNTMISISVYALHHSNHYWNNPEQFNPDRYFYFFSILSTFAVLFCMFDFEIMKAIQFLFLPFIFLGGRQISRHLVLSFHFHLEQGNFYFSFFFFYFYFYLFFIRSELIVFHFDSNFSYY